MYRMAAQVIHGTQIPFEVLLPLIDQTAAKVHSLAPKDAQTGPATRADGEVVMKHIELLEKMQDGEFLASDLQFTYMNMSQIIQTASLPQDEPGSHLLSADRLISDLMTLGLLSRIFYTLMAALLEIPPR